LKKAKHFVNNIVYFPEKFYNQVKPLTGIFKKKLQLNFIFPSNYFLPFGEHLPREPHRLGGVPPSVALSGQCYSSLSCKSQICPLPTPEDSITSSENINRLIFILR
jgi:hypothetical protein